MSYCLYYDAITRIDAATPASPLVVRKLTEEQLKRNPACVEVSFFNTVYGRKVVNDSSPLLVGVFHNLMNREEVYRKVYDAIHDGREFRHSAEK